MKHLFILLSLPLFFACNDSETPLKEPYNEATLGELLFFDPLLSADSTVSCASCHKPEYAFSDNNPVSKGVGGKTGNRNAPSAMNQSTRNFQYWDGRLEPLEEIALGPKDNPVKINLPLNTYIHRTLHPKP